MQRYYSEYATEPSGPYPMAPSRGLIEILWQRRLLIVLGLALGLALGGVYHLTATPAYSSSAQLLVLKKRTDTGLAADATASEADEFLSSQLAVLRSPVLISRAIEKGNLCPLESFAGEKDDLTEAIGKRLTVSRNREPGGGSNSVFTLSFKGAQPGDCDAVLQSLLDAYVETLDEAYRKGTDEAVDLIARARNVLQEDLAKKEAEYRDFRRNAPLLWTGKEWTQARQERLAGIETKRTALLVRRAELQGQLTALENAVKDGRDRERLIDLVVGLSSKQDADPAAGRATRSVAMQDVLHPLLMQERRLQESFGDDHPELVALRKRIETTRALFSRPSAAWERTPQQGDLVESYLQYLRQELEQIKASEKLLAELFEQEHAEAKKLSSYEVEDETIRNDIARSQQLFEGIVRRLQDARLARDVGGYEARVIAPPGTPRKVEPNLMLSLSLSVLLSLLGAAGLVGLAEMLAYQPPPAPDRNGFYNVPKPTARAEEPTPLPTHTGRGAAHE